MSVGKGSALKVFSVNSVKLCKLALLKLTKERLSAEIKPGDFSMVRIMGR